MCALWARDLLAGAVGGPVPPISPPTLRGGSVCRPPVLPPIVSGPSYHDHSSPENFFPERTVNSSLFEQLTRSLSGPLKRPLCLLPANAPPPLPSALPCFRSAGGCTANRSCAAGNVVFVFDEHQYVQSLSIPSVVTQSCDSRNYAEVEMRNNWNLETRFLT